MSQTPPLNGVDFVSAERLPYGTAVCCDRGVGKQPGVIWEEGITLTTHTIDESTSDLPSGLSKPAQRALAAAGYKRLAQFTTVSEADLLQLHGMGPKALEMIRSALRARGQSFAESAAKDAVRDRSS